MQAIKTKYLPATNHRPSRIKAECEAGSITIPYEHNLNSDELHVKAAYMLIKKLNWTPTRLYSGDLQDCKVHILIVGIPPYLDINDLPEFLKQQA